MAGSVFRCSQAQDGEGAKLVQEARRLKPPSHYFHLASDCKNHKSWDFKNWIRNSAPLSFRRDVSRWYGEHGVGVHLREMHSGQEKGRTITIRRSARLYSVMLAI